MNNEPVAWIRHKKQDNEIRWEITGVEPPPEVIENMEWKPLYTEPQTKILSDDVIKNIAKRYSENMDSFGNLVGIPEDDIFSFVNEVLRKAQEK